MKLRQAFKYELIPNGEQGRQMRRFAGSCRFVYNEALALQKARHAGGAKKLGYAALCRRLTEWRHSPETAWLALAPVHPLQQALRDLGRAYDNFFAGRARFPRFRKKGRHDRFRYPDAKQIRLDQANSRLFLPKLDWLRYRNSRDVLGTVRSATVSHSGGKWFVAIQTEREVARPVPQGGEVGIDMGVKRFAHAVGRYLPRSAGEFPAAREAAPPRSARAEPQGQVQQQLEEGESPRSAHSCPYRQRAPGLSAQVLDRDQPEPRGRLRRGLAGAEHVQVCERHRRTAGQTRSGQGGPESGHPRSGLVRVPPAVGLQAGVEGRPAHRCAGAQYELQVPELWPRLEGQPA